MSDGLGEIPAVKVKKVMRKCLINYFSHLKNVEATWNEVCKSAKEITKALKNRFQQLRLVKSVKPDKPEIFKVTGLREKLISKLFRGIQEELTLIGNLLTRLKIINQELKNKLMRLEEARCNFSSRDSEMEEIVNGTPDFPKLEQLLIWAKELCDYYQELYQNINVALNSLDYEKEETIERLEKAFHVNFRKTKIERIRVLTENLSNSNIHQF